MGAGHVGASPQVIWAPLRGGGVDLRPRPCKGEPAEGGKEGVLQGTLLWELRPRRKPTRTRGPSGMGIQCVIFWGGKINLCERQGSVPCHLGFGGPVFMPPPSPGPGVSSGSAERVHRGGGAVVGRGVPLGRAQEVAEAGV